MLVFTPGWTQWRVFMFVVGIMSDRVTRQCSNIPTWLLSPAQTSHRGFLRSLKFVDS